MIFETDPDILASTVQFQMPQFVLGGAPNLAHGGGAEALPGMYGQGAQAWSDYDKYWYDHSGPSKYYTLSDCVANPRSENITPKSSQTPRPFDFIDSPQGSASTSSPAAMHVDQDSKRDTEPYFIDSSPSNQLSYPHASISPPVPQFPALSFPNYSFPNLSSHDPTAPLPPIPANGLPLYSASGFDMLRMLGKVATRPNPKIVLGPVDMTCSFVVVDTRRFDSPIVYASPTFTRLTGYPESEVLGRNCRFLQSPSGQVERGEERRYTAPDAVRHLQKCLLQEKECQASLINYRKDGGAFINLVTVIPIAAEEGSDEVTHHVGFQVDLAEQPNAILEKLRDGSYIVNYSSRNPFAMSQEVRRGRGVSQEMIALLHAGRWAATSEPSGKTPRDRERAELHAMLLENTDDFIHVVSLKGALLYVAPSIQRILAYDAAELIGKSIGDLCHPSDIVPLMRELKEASALPAPAVPPASDDAPTRNPLFSLPQSQQNTTPKPVNLLFRARHKNGQYLWLEARGRLHVEQGKGRKAVVLVGRRASVPNLRWGAVSQDEAGSDCWGLVAPNGLVLSAGGVGAERLGYGTDGAALVGRSLASLVQPDESRRVSEVLAGAACADKDEARRVQCEMLVRQEEGLPARAASAEIVFFAHERSADNEPAPSRSPPLPSSLIFRIRFVNRPVSPPGASETLKSVLRTLPAASSAASPRPATRPPDTNVLEELDTARETSWQYELTRLRFENQRMRDEVGKLERMHRAQMHMPQSLARQMAMYGRPASPAPLPSMSVTPPHSQSHPQPQPHPHPRLTTVVLPPAPQRKRTRDGELKMQALTP